MIGLVLVTHGRLAEELRLAMEHVVGPQRAVATVCIVCMICEVSGHCV